MTNNDIKQAIDSCIGKDSSVIISVIEDLMDRIVPYVLSSYDNAMHTLIKRYIRAGYSSVIAPMWSLSTEILPTWLDVFMEGIMNEQFVIDALYKANMAVKEKFTSPEVYACLHLFGNPFLQIGDRPVLGVIEN